ncbi:MAG: hypothetical protein M0C28_37140 [Candidatus Moduliflexus flocculans]|nr:hypothetical protein [Candidatus Moduliflexus flocculans]
MIENPAKWEQGPRGAAGGDRGAAQGHRNWSPRRKEPDCCRSGQAALSGPGRIRHRHLPRIHGHRHLHPRPDRPALPDHPDPGRSRSVYLRRQDLHQGRPGCRHLLRQGHLRAEGQHARKAGGNPPPAAGRPRP